jgi:hypothetical protein
MNGNNESANKKERAASSSSSSPTDPPLKIIEDMLHNKILHKKQEIQKTKQPRA